MGNQIFPSDWNDYLSQKKQSIQLTSCFYRRQGGDGSWIDQLTEMGAGIASLLSKDWEQQ